MRHHLSLLLAGVTACSSSNPMNTGDDQPMPDAAVSTDAPVDGEAPLAGKACTTSVVEVARIPNANLNPSNNGVFARDADNDGKPDILVFEFVSSTTTDYRYRIRLFRQGATGFLAPTSSEIVIPKFGIERVTVGDFNGDQLLDVALIYSTETPARAPYVYPAMQQADHTFIAGARIDVSACKSSNDERLFGLAVMDLDRDGEDDLLTTVSYGGLGANPEGLTLLKGTTSGLSSGTCIASATVAVPGIPAIYAARQLVVGDFDGDGDQDLVTNTNDKGRLFYSTAASTFASTSGEAAIPFIGQTQPNVLKTRVQQDLIHAQVLTAGSEVRRYVLDATAGISTSVVAMLPEKDETGNLIFRGIVAGDLNGDGLSDALVVGRQQNVSPSTFAITCDRTARWDIATGTFPDAVNSLRAIDFDGDGRTEVLARTATDAVVYAIQ